MWAAFIFLWLYMSATNYAHGWLYFNCSYLEVCCHVIYFGCSWDWHAVDNWTVWHVVARLGVASHVWNVYPWITSVQCPFQGGHSACLAAEPAGHAGVTAATSLSESRESHECKVVDLAADIPNWWLQGHLQSGVSPTLHGVCRYLVLWGVMQWIIALVSLLYAWCLSCVLFAVECVHFGWQQLNEVIAPLWGGHSHPPTHTPHTHTFFLHIALMVCDEWPLLGDSWAHLSWCHRWPWCRGLTETSKGFGDPWVEAGDSPVHRVHGSSMQCLDIPQQTAMVILVWRNIFTLHSLFIKLSCMTSVVSPTP